MSCNAIYKGDDTNAFNQKFITINAKNLPDGWEISKAEVRIGDLPVMIFDEAPIFPIEISLTSEMSSLLNLENNIYLAIYDMQGRKLTCNKSAIIKARAKVI